MRLYSVTVKMVPIAPPPSRVKSFSGTSAYSPRLPQSMQVHLCFLSVFGLELVLVIVTVSTVVLGFASQKCFLFWFCQ